MPSVDITASSLHRGNASNKNGPAQVKQQLQWEAPFKLLAVDDPLLRIDHQRGQYYEQCKRSTT